MFFLFVLFVFLTPAFGGATATTAMGFGWRCATLFEEPFIPEPCFQVLKVTVDVPEPTLTDGDMEAWFVSPVPGRELPVPFPCNFKEDRDDAAASVASPSVWLPLGAGAALRLPLCLGS